MRCGYALSLAVLRTKCWMILISKSQVQKSQVVNLQKRRLRQVGGFKEVGRKIKVSTLY